MDAYDLIILGAGPAGITAAVYAARKQLNSRVFSLDVGGQTAWSGDIENYTGYQFISGPELTIKFQEHISQFGVPLTVPERVVDITKESDIIVVATDKGRYEAKTVIVATGKRPRPLEVPGEDEYKNKGVTYCATCDGPVFRDKAVAVIGGGNSALDAALQLMKICPQVYIVDINERLSGDPVMIQKVTAANNVEVVSNSQVTKIYGDTFVKGIEVQKEGKNTSLDVEGVFVEIGLIPNSECAALLSRNDRGEIVVDKENKTSIEGIFAAGDVTDVPEKQIIIACGEGSKACLSAFRYLSTHNF